MKQSRRYIPAILMALVVSAGSVAARQLTPEEALASMRGGASKVAAVRAAGLELAHTFKSSDAALNTMYVFSRPADNGFVILSADDVAAPLLGYSDSGEFNAEDMPANLRAWIDNYSAQIAAAAASGGKVLSAPAKASRSSIAPIVTTRWDQDAPFNGKAPVVGGTQCVTGCVATAIAQVVNHHEWPNKGVGSESYSWNGKTLSFDYAGTSFDWANMLDEYSDDASKAQVDAVATLMYACGVASHMNYGTQASGATEQYLIPNLISKLRYDKSLVMAPRDYFLLDEWTDKLYDEIAADRPVFYTGATISNEGHAFVIDGYSASDGLFHVNWGWGGLSDGYFAITELDPATQGIGGGSAGFIVGQSGLFGLKKSEAGSTYTPLFCANGFGTDSETYSRSGYVDFNYGGVIYNSSAVKMEVDMGVKLVNKATGATSYVWWGYAPQPVEVWGGYESSLSFDASDFPSSGSYTVTPVVRVGSQVADVRVHVFTNRSLSLECSANRLVFSSDNSGAVIEAVDVRQDGNFYVGKTARLTATVKNTGDSEYLTMPIMCGFAYGTKTFQFVNVVATVGIGHTASYTFTGNLPSDVPAGRYPLVMTYFDMSGNQKQINLNGAYIEILDVPKGDAVLELVSVDFPDATGGRGTNLRPWQIPVDPARFTLNVKCTSGYFDGYVGAFLLDEDGMTQYDAPFGDPVAFGEGESQSVSIAESWAAMIETGTKYLMIPYYGVVVNGKIEPKLFPDRIYITPTKEAGIIDAGSVGGPRLYPNPASDFVVVEAPSAVQSVEVYSLSGALMLSRQFLGSASAVTIGVGELPAGVYVVRFATATGVGTLRLIKN